MTTQQEEKNYRFNFTVNLVEGASYWFGASFISATTILPLFISKLTPSLWPIGLVSMITSAGWFLPQLFSARITERFAKMKTIVVGWGFLLERLPVFLLILGAFLARKSPQLALVIFLVSLAWYVLGAGVVAPSWMGLVAKIFPPEKRGSFLGLTTFIGVGMGALGSIVSAWLLNNFEFPQSFEVLFAIAALFMFISWVAISFTREPSSKIETHDQNWASYRKDLLQILKTDQNFRRFIITTIIITMSGMGTGFITISAIQRFHVSDATVGLFTLSMLLGQAVGNLVLGWIADKYGHKLPLEIGAAAALIAFILSIVIPIPSLYFLVYVLLGINISSVAVSGILVVWEFCETSRVPTYSGLANTTRGFFSLVAPLIGTQLAQRSYGLLFGICSVLTLIGILFLKYWVKEPRWKEAIADIPDHG